MLFYQYANTDLHVTMYHTGQIDKFMLVITLKTKNVKPEQQTHANCLQTNPCELFTNKSMLHSLLNMPITYIYIDFWA